MDELTIIAEARPESWDGRGLSDHADRISAHIKNSIGITSRVKVVAPDTLERSLGKAKRLYDKRPKE
jgi:phenylacetate-CoA ligase